MKSIRARFDGPIRYLLYPLFAATTLTYLAYELTGPRASIGHRYGWYVGTLVVLMVLIESAHALRADWRMTWSTFWRRDLPFLVVGASTIALANWVAQRIVTEHAMTPGRRSNWFCRNSGMRPSEAVR